MISILMTLRFKGLSNTTMFVSGTLKGLPDPKKFVADVDFKYLNTGEKIILSLIPKESVPTDFDVTRIYFCIW